jgi:hypothetical protein
MKIDIEAKVVERNGDQVIPPTQKYRIFQFLFLDNEAS